MADKPDGNKLPNPTDTPEYRYVPDWVKDLLQADPEDGTATRLEDMRSHVARTLQWARHSTGMTQALVAKVSGLKQSMVAKLESEKNPGNPTLDSLVKYLDALGAELIISAMKGERVFTPGGSAGRVVMLSDEVARQAEDRGLTVSEYVMLCISRSEAADAAGNDPDC
jgi:transcriptional regulator with XRE-family HTH domain